MTPKVYRQIVQAYEAMEKQAKNGVYRGYITYLFEELGIGISAYTPVMRRMVAMGCIRQLVAGARNVPSEWELIQTPTPELFARHTDRRKVTRIEDLVATTKKLEARIEKLESTRGEPEEMANGAA